MPQSFTCLHYHFVFSTKHRTPLITPEIQPRLYAYFGDTLRDLRGWLIAAGGLADHVHLLARLSREISVAEAMREIKAGSSRWVLDTFPTCPEFAWQAGYGAFTVSYSQLEVVKDYVLRQEIHHANQSFQDEFRALLRKHDIPFDERYLWD